MEGKGRKGIYSKLTSIMPYIFRSSQTLLLLNPIDTNLSRIPSVALKKHKTPFLLQQQCWILREKVEGILKERLTIDSLGIYK
jgi:hypothetical protein